MITLCPLCQQELVDSTPYLAATESVYKRCKSCLKLDVPGNTAFEVKYFSNFLEKVTCVDLTVKDKNIITYYHVYANSDYTTIDHIWKHDVYTTMQKLITVVSDKLILKIPALPLSLFQSRIDPDELYNRIKLWITFS